MTNDLGGIPAAVAEELQRRGLVAQRKGGRPPKVARDVAVFLADKWRRNELDETAAQSAEWIVEAWKHGGIMRPENVRARLAAAKKAMPKQMMLIITRGGCVVAIEAPAQTPLQPWIHEGAYGWLWAPGMAVAMKLQVGAKAVEPPPAAAPLAAAIRQALR